MKSVAIALVSFGVGALTAMGQQSTAVNSSRSNIKNNIVVVQGPDGKVRCKASGKDCTKEQVDLLNQALTSTKAAPDPGSKGTPPGEAQRLAHSKGFSRPPGDGAGIGNTQGVTLAPDGSLTCMTTDGKQQPCNAAHLADLSKAAAAMPGANDPIGGAGVGLGKKKPD